MCARQQTILDVSQDIAGIGIPITSCDPDCDDRPRGEQRSMISASVAETSVEGAEALNEMTAGQLG